MPAIWLPVTHRKQKYKADCLVACAAMLLEYNNKPVADDVLIKVLRVEVELGAAASNIKHLTSLGVKVDYASGTLADLIYHLQKGQPSIAFVDTMQLGYWSEATRHAVVVVGIDEQFVYLNDPFFTIAPQKVSHLEFELAWDKLYNAYAIIYS